MSLSFQETSEFLTRHRDLIMEKLVSFLNKIGIPCLKVHEEYIPKNTFCKNVLIKNGSVLYSKKAKVSDMLHEAGHIAIFPKEIRPLASGYLNTAYRKLGSLISDMGFDDERKLQAYMGCDDDGATAWAWCVGTMLGYKDSSIIKNEDYGGDGLDVMFSLKTTYYSGNKRLYYLGLLDNTKNFPNLDRFLNPY